MNNIIQVSTTFTEKEDALQLARHLLDKHLIACAQLSSPFESLYCWKGKVEQEQEFKLTMKTTEALWEELKTEIETRHSYDVPEILAVPVLHANEKYEKWLQEEIKNE